MHFYKYQGTGNDFVMIDNRGRKEVLGSLDKEVVARLCHRRFGIGADGLILLQDHPEYDFQMVYFNADGNQSSMCGNGGRCIVRFAHHLGVFTDKTRFLAIDGPHDAFIADGLVHLKMSDVSNVEQHLVSIPTARALGEFDFLNTGSPHYVRYVDHLKEFNVFAEGKQVRYHDYFTKSGGTNVNFVEHITNNSLFVRTYERGVEDETYSCGTGVTACALSASLRLNPASNEVATSTIHVQTLGGNLRVSFTKQLDNSFNDIYLIGPAEKVFEGEFIL